MTACNETQELKDRLNLIESMIAEGRRTTSSYGWTFALWGVAYYVAIYLDAVLHFHLAWEVTMTSAAVLTAILCKSRSCSHPPTTTGRALGALWFGTGFSMFIVLFSLGYSGRMDLPIFVAVICGMLGSVNAASSVILKWKLQFACALVWWATTIYACFGKGHYLMTVFVAAIFFCQIVFGIYLMIIEARRRQQGAAHA
jgi:hypothetical protein